MRILFPGAGLLVMSAWCLGVLNSHHRFFASYTAPVAWNVVMIGALIWYGPRSRQDRLAIDLACASVAGAALQIVVQLPQTLPLLGRLRLRFRRVAGLVARPFSATCCRSIVGRGVGQMSGYVDNLLASLLPTGAVAAINYAQILYFLPVSLFGLSVAAAELPSMSRATVATNAAVSKRCGSRLNAGLRQIAFLVVPSSAAFIFIGDAIVTLLFQSGSVHPSRRDLRVGDGGWRSVGMLAATTARLYISAFYALSDPRTPFRFALVRVTLTLVLGYLCAIPLPHADRNRSAMGRGRAHRVGGSGGMGRVRDVAAEAQPAPRMDRNRAPRTCCSCGGWRCAAAVRIALKLDAARRSAAHVARGHRGIRRDLPGTGLSGAMSRS